MSELYGSLNFPHQRSIASGSNNTLTVSTTSPHRLHGTARRQVAEAAAKAAAAVDAWHRHEASAGSSKIRDVENSSTRKGPASSTPSRASLLECTLMAASSQEADPTSSPSNMDGRVYWNASPSPSLQLQAKSLAAMTRAKPLDTQAFREELLKAPSSNAGSHGQSAASGSRTRAATSVPPSAGSSEDRQRSAMTRRRGARRSMRRSATSASNLVESLTAGGLDELLHDLTDHLGTLGYERELREEEGSFVAHIDDPQRSQIDSALLERLAQGSSQEVPSETDSRTELRRSQTWARTVSMPTRSPSRKIGEVALSNADEAIHVRSEGSLLGKRQLPRSPMQEDSKGTAQVAARQAATSPSRQPTPRRFQRTCSEGIRPALAGSFAFNSMSQGQTHRDGSPPKKLRGPTALGTGRGVAPRVGLSKSTWSAPATSCLNDPAVLGNGSVSNKTAKTLHSQFKPPLRRSPRKAAAASTSSTAAGTSLTKSSGLEISRTSLFDKSAKAQIGKTVFGSHGVVTGQTHSTGAASLLAIDERGGQRTSGSAADNDGDASFDTSMTSVDESALCDIADMVEATQAAQSSSSMRASGANSVQSRNAVSPQPAAHPLSDDSMEMVLSGELDDAVLASMDAHGW